MDIREALGWKEKGPPQKDPAQMAKELFNAYQAWFETLDPTDEEMHVDLGGVIVHAFGSDKAKQEFWKARKQEIDRDSFFNGGETYPTKDWGPATAGVSLSGKPREVLMDLRKTKQGKLVLPLHVLGHEQAHTLNIEDQRLVNPDELTSRQTYEANGLYKSMISQ